ncbi:MAG: hypothetical protein H6621_03995 [Halobacteriovoraceae bacterium]|nr:hypothetical protein [Halobacteriovoraceae bacterium]MCB9094211.1 hypothetical protein [Halobacteriovoraceae bacterium]
MKTLRLTLIFALVALVSSCGNKNNRTYGDGYYGTNGGIPPVGVTGIDPTAGEGAPLAQKYASIISQPQFACSNGARRFRIGFTLDDSTGTVVGLNPAWDLNNLAGVKGVYIGKTPENDIVIVKEFGNIKDVLIDYCDLDQRGNQLSGVQINSYFSASKVTSCSVNQISELIFDATIGGMQIPFWVGPINATGAVNGVCPTDFNNDYPL